jgi:TolB-like protein/Flp pilus assembly protein TadD
MGLVSSHAAGLVHRDLKPENIFLTRSGTTKLLDFGIAKLAQDDAVPDGFSTLTGVVLGTAGYLAPEQIKGEDVDARADLFSLGAVLSEMLTGARPFAREHVVETLHAILHDSPPDVFRERPDVPPSLAGIIRRLLEKAPDARFQSSADVLDALERVQEAAVEVDSGIDRKSGLTTGWRWPASTPRAHRTAWPAVALCAIAIAAGTVAWYPRTSSLPVAASPTAVTLAIMPFRSIPAGGDDLLELGLADILISRLGQLAEVRVLPLTATERRRAQDPREAARELGATHALTGLLQRDTGRVRATVHLLSASDGRTIWTTPIDVDSSNAFSVQDGIVTRVIEELAPRLTVEPRRRLADPGTRRNDAFEAYLNGRIDVRKPARVELMRAAAFFLEAVKLDPGYADAWAGLASAYMRMPIAGDARPAESFADAKRAASRALELDPAHAEAQSVLGAVAFWHEWDYARAERLLRAALELQPSSVNSQLTLAHLLSNVGRHGEALTEIRRARALDPTWAVARSLEGQFLFMARQYDEALAHMDTMVEIEPSFAVGHTMRAYALLALGRYEEAIRECAVSLELTRGLDNSAKPYSWLIALHGYALARMGRPREAVTTLAQLRSQARAQYVPPHHEALLLHALGRDDEALERLRASVDGRDVFATFLGVDPKWDALRDVPAFRDLVSRVNLLDASDRARRPVARINP